MHAESLGESTKQINLKIWRMEDSMKTKSFKESEEVGLRRGPWTLEEDTLLTNYILHNGEGRWNLVAKSAVN